MPEESPSPIVLITGCSSGFGLLTAARLASHNYTVIATMRNLDKQSELLSEVNKRGGKVQILRLDVTDQGSIDDAIEEIAAKYGYLDVLVNNAGYALAGAFEDLSQEEIRMQMETNFFGVQNVTRRVIPLMRHRKKGKIINISSVAGLFSSPGLSAYNCSKWAVEAFSESLRYELKLFGIDVLLIEPGMYKTKIFFENRRLARNFENPESPYFVYSRQLKKQTQQRVDDCHKDNEDIAVLVEKLIQAKNPSFRNIPDIEAQIVYFLRRILPFRFFCKLIERYALKS